MTKILIKNCTDIFLKGPFYIPEMPKKYLRKAPNNCQKKEKTLPEMSKKCPRKSLEMPQMCKKKILIIAQKKSQ